MSLKRWGPISLLWNLHGVAPVHWQGSKPKARYHFGSYETRRCDHMLWFDPVISLHAVNRPSVCSTQTHVRPQ